MSLTQYSMASLPQFVGRELGVSDWLTIDQPKIDAFAACTGDLQWIHVDVERARRESPFGAPIAHGYLTLSVLSALNVQIGMIPGDAAAALNYGLDKVRFMAPVKAGARVRSRAEVMSAEDKGDGRMLLKLKNTLEIEGEVKPALVAEVLAMLFASKGR
jgi:acyl dehydratase